MSVVTVIRLRYEFSVKSLFTSPGFVSCHEQHSPTTWIKRKRDAPDAIGGFKTKLFHIRVAGALHYQRVAALIAVQISEEGESLPEVRPALCQAERRIPARIHRRFQQSISPLSMSYDPYVVNSIFCYTRTSFLRTKNLI